ncbi:MAG: TIGR03364 family FAD-dependent oxidoreductase [Chitinophagaceae bacterium]|nr:TIGR03364 family FAD-dependent oxidoreductase [Chitinophagaceae bacterium]
MAQKSAIVVGAGIVGLAAARALAVRNYRVTVIERNTRAVGASIRNFGMIWPVGQPDGVLYERALLSCSIWKSVCDEANIWYEQKGSLHLAYQKDEFRVLEELHEIYGHRKYELLNKDQILQRSPVVAGDHLVGGLYSAGEMVVDPTKAIAAVAGLLMEKYAVQFIWGAAVTDIAYPSVYSGKEVFEADEIFICSGFDFETLYPELFSIAPLTKCKLQMMRLAARHGNDRIGPSLCGALSLLHYASFKAAGSLNELSSRLNEEYPEEIKWGIHVMASQNEQGNITVGDSHEYGPVHDPFDKKIINDLILKYLYTFAGLENNNLLESWNGIYAKMTNGATEYMAKPEGGVTIINGLGGAGMTLGFGLCEEHFTLRS